LRSNTGGALESKTNRAACANSIAQIRQAVWVDDVARAKIEIKPGDTFDADSLIINGSTIRGA